MNIALSVLILILLLLPGATVIRAYTSSLTKPKSNLHVSFNDMLFRGLGFSVIIHCIFICITRWWFKYDAEYNLLYQLIAGKDISAENNNLSKFFRQFSLYVLLTITVSWAVTKCIRWIVLRFNFDLLFEGLSAQNYWYILFSGRYLENKDLDLRNIDFLFVDILTNTGSIYSGILVDYNYNATKDNIENIILYETHRRELIKDPVNDGGKIIGPPVPISGDLFMIPAKNMVNINVSYVSEIDDDDLEIDEEVDEQNAIDNE